MKKYKRFLSLLLTLCMVLSMIPGTAFAAGSTMPFTDVRDTDWFHDAVQYVYENDMMSGTGEETFSPDLITTRGMIVTILYKMEGRPAAVGKTFADVDQSQYYAMPVAWASENDIVSGYGSGMFGPNDPITREQLVVILYHYAQYKGYDVSVGENTNILSYTDFNQLSEWAIPAMQWACGAGLVSGMGDGTLAPKGSATRAQAAAVLMQFCKNPMDSGVVSQEDYTVIFEYNYGDKGPYKTETVKSGQTVKCPEDPARNGYSFAGWYTASSGGSKFEFNTAVIGDITLYAKWNKNSSGGSTVLPVQSYTVTFEANGGSGVAAQIVKAGMAVAEPETPLKDGYRFLGWYTDSLLTQPYDFALPVNKDFILYAGWMALDGAEQCRVTYVLNDGTPGAYEMQVLEFGAVAQCPQNPERENYAFTGWYTQSQAVTEYDFTLPVTGDLTLYAGWAAPDGGDNPVDGPYGASSGGGTIFSITDVRMNGDQVQVTVNTESISALVVRFLEEPDTWNAETVAGGKELAVVAAQTPEYCELIPVTIPVDRSLPEHYVIQAVLLDEDGEELCDPYTCVRYTSRYAAFSGQTVEDFPQERVLNFDQDATTNFGVLTEEVRDLRQKGTTTLVRQFSEDPAEPFVYNDYYIFANAGQETLDLQTGELVLAQNEDGEMYLFKVGTKEVYEDGTVVFTPDQEVALSEFYETLNVSMELDLEDAQLAQGANTPQTMMEVIDVDGEWSGSLGGKIEAELGEYIEVSGELAGTGSVEIEMTYDAKLFAEDYFYCSIISNLDLTLDIDVRVAVDNDDEVEAELKLAKVSIPTPITGLSVYFAPTVPTEWKISGGGNFEFTSKTSSGFTYDTYSGRQTVDKKERSIKLGLQGEAEISIGPKVALGVSFLEQVVKAEVNAQAGIKASASTEVGGNWTDAESKHACTLCLDGECKWFVVVKAKLSFCIVEDVLDATPINAELVKIEGWISFLASAPGKFYVSLINSTDSCFKGNICFGGGECPNKSWRIVVKAEDVNGNELANVGVKVFKSNHVDEGQTPYALYLYDGIYRVGATVSGTSVTKTFVVNKAPVEVTLTPSSSNGKLSGKIFDADANQAISNALILVKQGDMVISSCDSNQSGNYEVTLPDGIYRIEITKNGYIPFTIYETVEDGRTTYLESAMMIQGSNQWMGGFSGQITDAVTGAPVSGVTLKVRSGWNNAGDGEVIKELVSDENGRFKVDIANVFGIIFGLRSGNYTVTASKPGYVTSSFNAMVLPGVVNPNQNGTISPEMKVEDGEYRVVLTWGLTPADLDSHYNAVTVNNVREHIYFVNQVGISANLDVDDVTSYGPETVTVTSFSDLRNGFTYSVHDFTNGSSNDSSALSASGAIVRVYNGNTLLRTYNVPADRKGTVWNVFSIDKNGSITDLNIFEYISDPEKIGASYAVVNSIALFSESGLEIAKDYAQIKN